MALTYPQAITDGTTTDADEMMQMFHAVAAKFARGIVAADLAALCIESAKIAEEAVITSKFADDGVTQAKVADDSIGGPQTQTGAIGAAAKNHIADDGVSWADHIGAAMEFFSKSYEGDGSSNRQISGFPWTPDWVWVARQQSGWPICGRSNDSLMADLFSGSGAYDAIADPATWPTNSIIVDGTMNANNRTYLVFAWRFD